MTTILCIISPIRARSSGFWKVGAADARRNLPYHHRGYLRARRALSRLVQFLTLAATLKYYQATGPWNSGRSVRIHGKQDRHGDTDRLATANGGSPRLTSNNQ